MTNTKVKIQPFSWARMKETGSQTVGFVLDICTHLETLGLEKLSEGFKQVNVIILSRIQLCISRIAIRDQA
jgi:hypothetical protein